jgi:Calpain family cysteine protease
MEFPANDSSLYRDPTNPPEYAINIPPVEWKRPIEISDEPVMMRDNTNPGDVKQGALGDCYFIESVMTLSVHPELLKNLIVYDGLEYGFAVF